MSCSYLSYPRAPVIYIVSAFDTTVYCLANALRIAFALILLGGFFRVARIDKVVQPFFPSFIFESVAVVLIWQRPRFILSICAN
jgi:hypothetical protein